MNDYEYYNPIPGVRKVSRRPFCIFVMAKSKEEGINYLSTK